MQTEIEQGRLISVPLHAPELLRPLGIVHRKRKKFNLAAQAFPRTCCASSRRRKPHEARRSTAWIVVSGRDGSWRRGRYRGRVRAACAARQLRPGRPGDSNLPLIGGRHARIMEALSWLARGALDEKQYDRADKYATETRQLVARFAESRRQGRRLHVTALGAAIEVHAHGAGGARATHRSRRLSEGRIDALGPGPPSHRAFKRTSTCFRWKASLPRRWMSAIGWERSRLRWRR